MSSEKNEYGERHRPSLQVTDPEDYNRTQRFREIHTARQRVSDFVAEMEMPDNGTSYYLRESTRLGHLVSLYIMELEPLIVNSNVGEVSLPDNMRYDSLVEFASLMGINVVAGETQPPSIYEVMRVYSAANRFYARIGMDLELEEDQGDASFEYSDLLEEGPPGSGNVPEIEGEGEDS